MDALYLLQSAQQAGMEVPEPVSGWAKPLSAGAQAFFQSAAELGYTNAGISEVSLYFGEALRLKDPAALKPALGAILTIARSNLHLYPALSGSDALQFLQNMLHFPDPLITDKVAALLSGVMCRKPNLFTIDQVHACADYSPSTEAGKMTVLANLLKNDSWREDLMVRQHTRVLAAVGAGGTGTALPATYKAAMCLWLAAFRAKELEGLLKPAIESLNEMLKGVRAEKAVRISLMALENMLKSKSLCEAMAEKDVLSTLSSLEYEKWRDPELLDLITKVKAALQSEVKFLTNYERFEREVMSGVLRWGFIHSDKFWADNAMKCERGNFKVIDHLLVLVRTGRDPETVAVACHDLGEFARLHPGGKALLTARGAKVRMLELMGSAQRDVAREALLCVQKLMLSRSMEPVMAF